MLNPSLFRAALWISIYLLLVTAPLLVLLTGQVPAGAGFWWDFSMALGFAALAMFAVQFLLTARFRRAAAPFGIDIIYRFHRYAAVIAFGLLAAHFFILRVNYVESLGALDPRVAPWYMSAGRAAFVLFALVIVSSLWRKPLRIDYDHWRMAHALLATLAFLAAVAHVEGVGYYTAAPWKRLLWSGYSLAWVGLIVYVRLAKPLAMQRRPWRVAEVRPEAANAWTLSLVPQGHAGMRFAPGQFAWLTLRASPLQLREHPFSFSSSAEDRERVEFTIKALGDFTATLKTVEPGETAWLDGPYGVFSPSRYRSARRCADCRRRWRGTHAEHVAHGGRPWRGAALHAHLRQQSRARHALWRRIVAAARSPQPDAGAGAGRSPCGLDGGEWLRRPGLAGAPTAGQPARLRILFVRPQAHDGCRSAGPAHAWCAFGAGSF